MVTVIFSNILMFIRHNVTLVYSLRYTFTSCKFSAFEKVEEMSLVSQAFGYKPKFWTY